jgi:hypothetical protein
VKRGLVHTLLLRTPRHDAAGCRNGPRLLFVTHEMKRFVVLMKEYEGRSVSAATSSFCLTSLHIRTSLFLCL